MSSLFTSYVEAGSDFGFRHFGLTTNKERFDELNGTLERKLDVYDKILSKQKYLGGDEITLADLFHIPYAVLLPVAGSTAIESRPNVAR